MTKLKALLHIMQCKLAPNPSMENIEIALKKIDHICQYFQVKPDDVKDAMISYFKENKYDHAPFNNKEYIPDVLTEYEIDVLERLIEDGIEKSYTINPRQPVVAIRFDFTLGSKSPKLMKVESNASADILMGIVGKDLSEGENIACTYFIKTKP